MQKLHNQVEISTSSIKSVNSDVKSNVNTDPTTEEFEGELPHTMGINVIDEVSRHVYSNVFQLFRELVANGIDSKTKKIKIRLEEKQVSVEDFGIGINNIVDFSVFGQSSKKNNDDIGYKGFGKLSALKLGKEVIYLTNNGKTGHKILMTLTNLRYKNGKADEFLSHVGTKIIITKLIEYVPTVDELSKYLTKVFAIRIARGFNIYINDTKLQIENRNEYLTEDELNVNKITITGNVYEAENSEKGSIDVYIKHVFITKVIIDPTRKFKGWINCNELTPTTSRDEIDNDAIYKEMVIIMRKYVSKFPEYSHSKDKMSNSEIMMGNEMNKMVTSYLWEQKINISGIVGGNKYKHDSKGIEEISVPVKGHLLKVPLIKEPVEAKQIKKIDPSEEDELTNKDEKNIKDNFDLKKVKRVNKNKIGIIWIDQDGGAELPPLYTIAPNIIVRNRTNPLYQIALANQQNLGPKWLRILLMSLADVILDFIPDINKKSRKEIQTIRYEIITNILKKHEELKEFFN